jgi:hypothetical protein
MFDIYTEYANKWMFQFNELKSCVVPKLVAFKNSSSQYEDLLTVLHTQEQVGDLTLN